MNTTLALSTALGAMGVTGQIVAAHRPIIGWSISIAAQPLWYAFYITVGAWPLLVLSTGYFLAATLHLRKALIARRGVDPLAYPARVARAARTRWSRRHEQPIPAA